ARRPMRPTGSFMAATISASWRNEAGRRFGGAGLGEISAIPDAPPPGLVTRCHQRCFNTGTVPSGSARTRTETPPALRLARADRRGDLLEAAAQLIVERGVVAVSMESVAERVGVSRPLVYK